MNTIFLDVANMEPLYSIFGIGGYMRHLHATGDMFKNTCSLLSPCSS